MSDGERSPGGTRSIPHDLGAEAALISAMLFSPDVVAAATEIVSAADFYKPAHGHLFDAALAVQGSGERADAITTAAYLESKGLLESVGGRQAVLGMAFSPSTTGAATRYARIISGHSLMRRLIGVASEIAEMGYEGGEDPDLVIDAAASLLYPLADRQRPGQAELVKDLLGDWLDVLEARNQNDAPAGLETGWLDLDEGLNGLRPGQLITICARPGMGKTAIGLAVGLHTASRGDPVLEVSAEMGSHELVDRLMANVSEVNSQILRSAKLSERDWARISSGIGRLGELPLWIDANPAASLNSIRAQVRRVVQRQGRLALVVVDYIQLLTTAGRPENRQVEVAELSRGLKRLALEAQVPVICLAQVNRGVEARADKRPTLADLRESGAIEADSDVVIGLYRDDYYNPGSPDAGITELIVLKHRAGPTGTVQLHSDLRYGRYLNLAKGA